MLVTPCYYHRCCTTNIENTSSTVTNELTLLGHFLGLFPGYGVVVFQLSHLLTQVVIYSVSTSDCEMKVTMACLPASKG